MRKTKIIATIGPASESDEVIRKFLQLKVDVLRLNFSHGNREQHLQTVKRIRRIAHEVGFEPAIFSNHLSSKSTKSSNYYRFNI